jgi:hypothetical protein
MKIETQKEKYNTYINKLWSRYRSEENKITEDYVFCENIVEKIKFQCFSNENPFKGDCDNLIFFTYNEVNVGQGGFSTRQSLGCLRNPHENCSDGGYIKGVALDLSNYMKLRKIFKYFQKYPKNEDFIVFSESIRPKIQKTKNGILLEDKCQRELSKIISELTDLRKYYFNALNESLKEKTDVSMLYCFREIL